MGVKFDSDGAMVELKRNLIVAMTQLQGEFLRDAQGGMRTPEGAASLYEGDVEVLANIITAQVVGGAWAAMDSMGTGSLMLDSSENPGLDDYINGPLWNDDYRSASDTRIRSRKRGETYTDIFGNEIKSQTIRSGYDLEKVERKSGKKPYKPLPPSLALQTAARWMENGRFQEVLQEAVSRVDWAKHFVETKE